MKKIICILLSILLVIGLIGNLNMSAYASDDEDEIDGIISGCRISAAAF